MSENEENAKRIMTALAKTIEHNIPKGLRFSLVVFSKDNVKESIHVSNSSNEQIIDLFRAIADKMELERKK